MITITINGKVCKCNEGEYILKVAQDNGIDIPNLCNDESVAVYGACGLCQIEVLDDGHGKALPKLMRACATKAQDGYVVSYDTERVNRSRKVALELLMSDHDGDCVAPCHLNCPAGTDIQKYLKQISGGDYHGAVETIKEAFPIPASIGRVCPHPCEKNCRRANVEQPLSIAFLKAYAADKDLADGTYKPQCKAESGKKVAIVGGGPAGLTAAFFLRRSGHSVTVYDAMAKMGGMLRYGIPAYRLPKDILERECQEIKSLGVEFVNNCKIGRDVTLEQLQKDNDAVIVANGAWKSMNMRVEGEELEGVVGGIDFLRNISSGEGTRPDLSGLTVAVCGGGNTAMDACRSAVRCGADKVYVVYRRTRDEMPAEDIEIEEAIEEGVDFKFLTNPAQIIGEDGKVKQMKLQVMQLGEPDASGRRSPVPVEGKFEYIDVDKVIMAIGQSIEASGFDCLEKTRKGTIAADENTFMTSVDGVFAVGDATNRGASIAIEAIGEANKCAAVVDSYLKGSLTAYRKPFVSKRDVKDIDFSVYDKKDRIKMPARPAEERKHDFNEVYLGFGDEEKVQSEAKRCLECGCHDYGDCRLIKYANICEIDPARFAGVKNNNPVERKLVSIERNPNKCILCSLCVRVCDEVAGKGILGLVGRGFGTVIKPEFNDESVIEACAQCGKCVEACPTGALKLLK